MKKDFGKYIVYSDGRIWSKSKDCFLNPAKTIDGYMIVNLLNSECKNGYRQSVTVHRIVALLFCDNPKNLNEVNHKDGNKTNNDHSNLEWCTRSENISHSYRLGFRSSKGCNNGNSKMHKNRVQL